MKCLIAKWETKDGNELTSNDLIRINPNKPMYGSMMLVATAYVATRGFLNKKRKVGFVVGEVETLKTIINQCRLIEGDDFSEKVAPVKIVTLEKLEHEVEPHTGFREKINPTTNEYLIKNGEKIVWKTLVVSESENMEDSYISYDTTLPINGEDRAVIHGSGEEVHFVGAAKIDISLKKQ